MNIRILLRHGLAVLSLVLPLSLMAEPLSISMLAERLTDTDSEINQKNLEEVEWHLQVLTVGRSIPSNSYHYVKARSWFDMARQEYYENDRTNAPHQALSQSVSLLNKLAMMPEYHINKIDWNTPHIESSKPVHPKLWELVGLWKKHAKFHCIEPEVAELEVTLVHAGHEHKELGWRHALSKIQAAERLAELIPLKLNRCEMTKPVPLQATACPLPVDTILPRYVHFSIDSSELAHEAQQHLDNVAVAMRSDPNIQLRLEGHTDQMASAAYNMGLSSRRGHAVRGYLQSLGIAAYRITVRAMGENTPVSTECSAKSQAKNRRVELVYLGANNVRLDYRAVGLEIEPVSQPCSNH